MVLLQINVVVNWGSTGRIAEEIGQAAIAAGWDSYIAYGRNPGISQSKLIRVGSKWDMYNHVLQTRLFDKHGLASKKATEKLIAQIEKLKPDIIHLHNIHGYYVNYPLLIEYLRKKEASIVWTLHDCWSFTGHCSHFAFIKCDKWKSKCLHCIQKKEYPASLIDRSTRNYLLKKQYFTSIGKMVLVSVSKWQQAFLKDSFLQKYQSVCIHNGVNTNVFSPKTVPVDWKMKIAPIAKYMVLGVTSVWNERKGLNDFIQLKEMLPTDYLIVLVGLTVEQVDSLPDGILGVSRTNSVEELALYYSAASVFVNPTWEDNFPTTNLEALACGSPVITYRTGGSVEAITVDTGIIVEQGDVIGLADAVKKICIKGKNAYRKACRERAVKYFNKEERYQEYLDLYHNLLSQTI